MKNLILVLSLFSFLVQPIKTLSQSYPDAYLQPPSVTPPSPDVASIEKFGTVPVDYSTGVPSITIPIWEINCGDLKWPLSISYHAGGIKVDEIASRVGLGWALTGPGVITRSVLGRPDEDVSSAPDYNSVTAADYQYLYLVRDGHEDSELDLFTYNFNGRSGKFYIKQDGSIFQIPYTNLKITHVLFNSFTIVDEKGVTYTFDKIESTATNESGILSLVPTKSSWYLSKVELADKKQTIEFQYTASGFSSTNSFDFTQSIGPKNVSGGSCGTVVSVETFAPPKLRNTFIQNNLLQLYQINFPNGHIQFNYLNDRQDIAGTDKSRLTSISIFNQEKKLKKYELGQSYFYYRPSNEPTSSLTQYRLRLDSLVEIAGNGVNRKPYKFFYNATPMVPRGNYAQDKWGFNNGKVSNQSLIQRETVYSFNGRATTYNVGSADRSVDTVQMKADVLEKIEWPTGGRTEYTFNVHQFYTGFQTTSLSSFQAYARGTSPQAATTTFTFPSSNITNPRFKVHISSFNFAGVTARPSVQLKDMTTGAVIYFRANLDPNAALDIDQGITLLPGHNYETKAFVYTNVSNSSLQAIITVEWDVYTGTFALEKGAGLRIAEVKSYASGNQLAGDDRYEYSIGKTQTPFKHIDQTYNDIPFVFYTSPCQGMNGCFPTDESLCRVFHSGSVYAVSTVNGSPVLYPKVTKYSIDQNGVDNGKTEYEYDVIQDAHVPGGGPAYHTAQLIPNDWKNGFLIRESHFKRSTSGYLLIKKTENEFLDSRLDQTYSLKVYAKINKSGCVQQSNLTVTVDIGFFPIPIYSGCKKLFHTSEITYDENGGENIKETYNDYDNPNNDFLTKSQTINSKDDTIIVTQKYPSDFAATGNIYAKMVTNNIVSPVIEIKQFKESTLLSTIKNNYRDWKGDGLVIAMDTVQASTFNNALETRIRYIGYTDRKNILEFKRDMDKSIAYIWDNNFQYPIAAAENLTQSNMAYTSFEADGKGNWTYSDLPIVDVTSPTGKNCYTLGSNITRTGLSATSTYIVSYWKKSGTVSVNGTTSKVGRSANGWTYYEHKVVNPAGGVITVSGSSGIIDELRLFQPDALMTTFTYSSLVGVTSKCDANNIIYYYEYDEFQRLMLIRDQNRNVLKKFAYNYSGQPEYPNIYYNQLTTGIFRRTTCTSCKVGANITYKVDANTYSSTVSASDADHQAQIVLDEDGQSYADLMGTCVAASAVPISASNMINISFSVQFHNTCTGTNYNFTIAGNASSASLSGVPEGIYNVTFTPNAGGGDSYYYTVNGWISNSNSEPILAVPIGQGSNNVLIRAIP